MYLYTDSQQIHVPGHEFCTELEQLLNNFNWLSSRISISKRNTFSSCFPTQTFSFHLPSSVSYISSDTQFLSFSHILYQIHHPLTGFIFRTHRNPILLCHQHYQLCLGLESVPPNWPLFFWLLILPSLFSTQQPERCFENVRQITSFH